MREGWALEFMINVAQSIGRFECIYLYSVKLRIYSLASRASLSGVDAMRVQKRTIVEPMENVGWHKSGDE
jgi:hypothetical protein